MSTRATWDGSANEWLITLRIRTNEPVAGKDVQSFAQEQAAFLNTQDSGLGRPGDVRWEVAKIDAR